MTTPRPTPFPAITPRVGVLVPFVIISDSNDEITTLPVRPTPPSSDRIPALYGYPLDSGDDSSNEDRSETAESLHTQTASTSDVHSPPTRPLPTSPTFACRPGKEILTSPPPLLRSSSSPPSLLPSSFSPPPPLLPSSSRKRSRSHSPSLPPLVSPSPLPPPPPAAAVPPPEHIESVRDNIETLRASLASAMHDTKTLHVRVRLLEHHDVVTRESLRIARGRITRSQLRVVYAEQEVRELREFQIRDGARRTDMTEQDIETLRARAEAVEQRAETLHVSIRAARMDVRDLIES
ncbi:hypothetical protein Tco_0272623 [Tanacetum coccineum]